MNYFDILRESTSSDKTYCLRKGQIVNVYYPDEEKNISKKYIEYDVVMFDGYGGQTPLQNVVAAVSFSSKNNYEYKTLQESSNKDESKLAEEREGDYVLLGFLNGDKNQPIILLSLDHPGLGSPFTKEEGEKKGSIFNGIKQEINKKGELEISLTGLLDESGKLKNSGQVPIVIKIGVDDSTTVEGDYHKFIITSGDESKILLETANKQSISIVDTSGSEKIEVKHKTGSDILMDTDGSVTSKDSSGGTIKLSEGKIGIGSGSNELLDLLSSTLDQLSTILDNILALTVSTAFGPSGTPINSADFTMDKSAIDDLKASIDSIKGSI